MVIKIRPIILWTELCCLYLLGPIGLTVLLRFELLNISKVPLVFFALFILSIVLLAKTPSFEWRSLLPSSWWPEWRTTVVFLLISATLMGLKIQLTNPNHFFWISQTRTRNLPNCNGPISHTVRYPAGNYIPSSFL